MEELVASLPGLWADHHVLKVRAALGEVRGIQSITATARDREVRVIFDPASTRAEVILDSLAAAGYPSGPVEPEDAEQETSDWSHAPRATTTSAVDLSMSGDYRKY